MFQGHTTAAVMLMGGKGNRYEDPLPKQFHLLDGLPLYLHTLHALEQEGWFDAILLVAPLEWVERVQNEVPHHRVLAGGSSRQESSFLGLQAVPKKTDLVLVHDAVRPFVSARILRENLEQALLHGAADTCIPSADTLVHVQREFLDHIPNRSEWMRGQTPQTFRYKVLLQAHQKTIRENASDDCSLVLDMGHPIRVVLGAEENIKITTPTDFLLAQMLLEHLSTIKKK